MNRARLAVRYAFQARLDEYRKILVAALGAGYRVCSVEESLGLLQAGDERLLVLRHDVDHRSPGVAGMAIMEAELGIASTYYFRLSTLVPQDLDLVKKHCHEVSLHYETIADYAIERNIADGSLLGIEHLHECADRLERDLRTFRATAGAPCRTLAAHGAPMNRQLGVTNNVLFDVIPGLSARLEILVEAYDAAYLGKFDRYISDTQWEINDGFRYGCHPLQAISRGVPRVILLTHPNHWAFSPRIKLRRVAKCLLRGQGMDSSVFAETGKLRSAL